jgi:hypothetical protein
MKIDDYDYFTRPYGQPPKPVVKYREDQPRVPAGQATGGQWTAAGAGRSALEARERFREARHHLELLSRSFGPNRPEDEVIHNRFLGWADQLGNAWVEETVAFGVEDTPLAFDVSGIGRVAGHTLFVVPDSARIGQRRPEIQGVTFDLPFSASLTDASIDEVVATAFGPPAKEPDAYTVRNGRDLVTHEVAHAAHVRERLRNGEVISAPDEWQDVWRRGVPTVKEMRYPEIAAMVSQYAARNPMEFVAESAVRLRRGETLTPEVMALYREVGGPEVRPR